MKLRVIAVGHKMPGWVEVACAEYIKRMPREASIEIIDIKPEKRSAGNSTENIQLIEAKRILEAIGKDYCVALDEHGLEITSLQLADKFKVPPFVQPSLRSAFCVVNFAAAASAAALASVVV